MPTSTAASDGGTSSRIAASTISDSNSSTCLAIGHGSVVTLWDYSSGQTLLNFNHDSTYSYGENRLTEDHHQKYALSDMEFSPNGQVIATSSWNSQHVCLSRASTGSLLAKIDVPSSVDTSTASGTVVPLSEVTSLHFGGGGRYMAFSTYAHKSDSKVYIFNLAKMKWVRSFSTEPTFICTKVSFDPSNTLLAALSTDISKASSAVDSDGTNILSVWNVREGKLVTSLQYLYPLPNTTNTNTIASFPSTIRNMERKGAMQFSPLIPHYCAIGCGSSVILYDLHKSIGVKSPFSTKTSATNGSNLNKKIASEPLLTLRERHKGYVTDIAFNPMARSLLASSSIADGCVKFHDIVTNKTIQTIHYPSISPSLTTSADKQRHSSSEDAPTCLKFHSNGVTFATGTMMGNVYVYDLRKIDSPTSPFLSKSINKNIISNSNCHLNAIVGKWNSPANINEHNISPGPVSHICFQEHLLQKKTKTSPKRPSSATELCPPQSSKLSPAAAVVSGNNAVLAAVPSTSSGGERSLDGNITAFPDTDELENENVEKPSSSSNIVDTLPFKVESTVSPMSKPQESLFHPHDDLLYSILNTTPLSIQGASETRPTQNTHTDAVSQNEKDLTQSSPPTSKRTSYNFDLVDANLDRLMKSIRLGPPLKSSLGENSVETSRTVTTSDVEQIQPLFSGEYRNDINTDNTKTHSTSVSYASTVTTVPKQAVLSNIAFDEIKNNSSLGSNQYEFDSGSRNAVTQVQRPSNASSECRRKSKRKTKRNLTSIENSGDETIFVSKLDLRHLIEDITLGLREEIGQSIRNMHIDLLRQFQIQSEEISDSFQQQKEVIMALIEENQMLRNENESLRKQCTDT